MWHIDSTLLGATTPGQSGPWSNAIEEVLHIPQHSSAEASLSDGLVSLTGHSLGKSNSSAEMQSAYSTSPVKWATIHVNYVWLRKIKRGKALFSANS